MDYGWFLINALAFVGTPAGMLYGWIAYVHLPEKSTLRARLAAGALILATLSVMCLVASMSEHLTPTVEVARLISRFGMYASLLGAAVSFSGKPRLIAPALLANIGSVMLWFGVTRP